MPKASADTARKLARLSTDCSFLLTHMIRQNGTPPKSDGDALATLPSILGLSPPGGPVLKGSPVGWYASVGAYLFDPATSTFKTAVPSPAVCFTDSTLAGLRAHRVVFDVKYGLAFDRDWLFKQGAAPCLNIREDVLKAEALKLPSETLGERSTISFPPSCMHSSTSSMKVSTRLTSGSGGVPVTSSSLPRISSSSSVRGRTSQPLRSCNRRECRPCSILTGSTACSLRDGPTGRCSSRTPRRPARGWARAATPRAAPATTRGRGTLEGDFGVRC
jgi:hypothetical protein